MNTPAHLIIAATVFAKPQNPRVNWATIIGGLLPDFSLYALAGWSLFVQGNTANYVFGTQYFSTEWQQIFAIDNSFFIWSLVIATGVYLRKSWLWALGGAGFLHLCFDFPLHHDDARQHFWPVSDWVFISPLSYWDPNHYGNIVGVVEVLLCVVCLGFLWRRFKTKFARISIAAVGAMQLLPAIFYSIFTLLSH